MSIKQVIREAFGYLLEYKHVLLKVLLIPIVVIFTAEAVLQQGSSYGLLLLLIFICLCMYALIALNTHRVILLGSHSVSGWGVSIPKKRELYFLLHFIGLLLIQFLAAFLSVIPVIGIIAAMGIIAIVAVRLALVLPAIATDEYISFYDAWMIGKGHQLVLIAIFLIPIIAGVVIGFINQLNGAYALAVCLSIFSLVFTIAMLSVAYKSIR